MSDNAKSALAEVVAHELSGRYSAVVYDRAAIIVQAVYDELAERGMVVFGPDGEPLDVTPLLQALGEMALDGHASTHAAAEVEG